MGVDWRNSKNLKDLSIGEALVVLGQITESLAQRKASSETEDSAADLHALVGDSPEAIQFCEAANALGRKLRGEPQAESFETILKRYRGQGSQARDEGRRHVEDAPRKSPAQDAVEYAESARRFHRK